VDLSFPDSVAGLQYQESRRQFCNRSWILGAYIQISRRFVGNQREVVCDDGTKTFMGSATEPRPHTLRRGVTLHSRAIRMRRLRRRLKKRRNPPPILDLNNCNLSIHAFSRACLADGEARREKSAGGAPGAAACEARIGGGRLGATRAEAK
jgi:hypothetical protein